MADELSHVDANGKASMVDVSAKPPQRRTARAGGYIELAPETIKLIRENQIAKGDVLTVARIAGISAAKRTADLIPLCHTFALDHVDVQCKLVERGVEIEASATCVGRTGVEMEALTAAGVCALTIYDMCKAVDKQMVIGSIRLISKEKRPIDAPDGPAARTAE